MSRTNHHYRLGPLLDCEWTLSRCRDVRDMTFEHPPRSENEKAQRARMKRLPSKRRRQDERLFLEDHMRYLLPDSACRIYILTARGRKILRESDLFAIPEACAKFGVKANIALVSEWEP